MNSHHDPTQQDLPPEDVAALLQVVRESGFQSVHYTGRADEGLLRGLLGMRPALKVTVMDIPDRWKTGSAFWDDDEELEDIPCRRRPDWLEGVPFYQEGAPAHDVSVRDWPWDSNDQLKRIVEFSARRRPRLIILFGDAEFHQNPREALAYGQERKSRDTLHPASFRHPAYDWQHREPFWIGRWNDGA